MHSRQMGLPRTVQVWQSCFVATGEGVFVATADGVVQAPLGCPYIRLYVQADRFPRCPYNGTAPTRRVACRRRWPRLPGGAGRHLADFASPAENSTMIEFAEIKFAELPPCQRLESWRARTHQPENSHEPAERRPGFLFSGPPPGQEDRTGRRRSEGTEDDRRLETGTCGAIPATARRIRATRGEIRVPGPALPERREARAPAAPTGMASRSELRPSRRADRSGVVR